MAQSSQADSLQALLKKYPRADTLRVNRLTELAFELQMLGSDQGLTAARQALQLSRQLKFNKGEVAALRRLGSYHYQRAEYDTALKYFDLDRRLASRLADTNALAWALNGIGTVYHSRSNYPKALQYYLQAVKLFEKIGKQKEAASIMGNAGVLYKEMGEFSLALYYYRRGLRIQQQRGDKNEIARFLNNIGGIYNDQGNHKQAEKSFLQALSLAEAENNNHLTALILRNLLEVKVIETNYSQAFKYGFRSLGLYKSLSEKEGIADVSFQLALAYLHSARADSALFYARQSLQLAREIGFNRNIHNTYEVLAQAYAAKKDFAQAYQAQRQFIAFKDSLTGEDKRNLVAGLKFQYELDKKQSQIELLTKDRQLQAEAARHQRQQVYALLAGLLLVGLLAGVLIHNNRQKQKANKLLQQQKEEIQRTLTELKATQDQLIQREKMASLGELTAGIAHEIQNPLNFVNNFSQVSVELLDELREGPLRKLKGPEKAAAEELLDSLTQNLNKINHHGKRADAIVKGMLQHSRSSAGHKELIDINALTDEFLRLSYHGLRAKEKAFYATIQTNYDPELKKLSVVPQDLGRVMLNLFSNAFYSVAEKKKHQGQDYEPTVFVSTRKLDGQAEIRVRDNGNGIPRKVVDKIFQPFFTTKPAGKGTGLGLSLSYDIITKGHGGQMTVETKEGGYAEFIIHLPVPHKKSVKLNDTI